MTKDYITTRAGYSGSQIFCKATPMRYARRYNPAIPFLYVQFSVLMWQPPLNPIYPSAGQRGESNANPTVAHTHLRNAPTPAPGSGRDGKTILGASGTLNLLCNLTIVTLLPRTRAIGCSLDLRSIDYAVKGLGPEGEK